MKRRRPAAASAGGLAPGYPSLPAFDPAAWLGRVPVDHLDFHEAARAYARAHYREAGLRVPAALTAAAYATTPGPELHKADILARLRGGDE
jgi:hypothetical protein